MPPSGIPLTAGCARVCSTPHTGLEKPAAANCSQSTSEALSGKSFLSESLGGGPVHGSCFATKEAQPREGANNPAIDAADETTKLRRFNSNNQSNCAEPFPVCIAAGKGLEAI